MGVEVLSVSVDSVFVHKIWNENELSKMLGKDVPFPPMLSDQNGNVGRLYGVYNEEEGVETRGRFLIDPDGIVQAFEVMTPPCGAQRTRNTASNQGVPTRAQNKRRRSYARRLETGQKKVLRPPGPPDLVGKVWKEWKVKEAFED